MTRLICGCLISTNAESLPTVPQVLRKRADSLCWLGFVNISLIQQFLHYVQYLSQKQQQTCLYNSWITTSKPISTPQKDFKNRIISAPSQKYIHQENKGNKTCYTSSLCHLYINDSQRCFIDNTSKVLTLHIKNICSFFI